jgi:ribosomal protein S18 acetylase RimI-like enzyme
MVLTSRQFEDLVGPFSDDDFTYPMLLHKSVGGATLSFDTEPDGTVYLYSLRVPSRTRGQGLARKAMRQFLAAVDRRGLTVKLVASPLDKRTSLRRLVAFYQGLGFVVGKPANLLGHPWMYRAPR